jgi:hypothetical protein
MGFERHGEKWSRGGEVPQTLELQAGLTSRIEVKFSPDFRLAWETSKATSFAPEATQTFYAPL